jgi:hypothetical protein
LVFPCRSQSLFFLSFPIHDLGSDTDSLGSAFSNSMLRTGFGFRTLYLLPSIIILLYLASTSSATCYFPNGQIRSDYIQCPGALSCCLKGESCLSNGLCFGANLGVVYRGLCADESWPIALCPRACYEGKLPRYSPAWKLLQKLIHHLLLN